jgi:hypothetical protein
MLAVEARVLPVDIQRNHSPPIPQLVVNGFDNVAALFAEAVMAQGRAIIADEVTLDILLATRMASWRRYGDR